MHRLFTLFFLFPIFQANALSFLSSAEEPLFSRPARGIPEAEVKSSAAVPSGAFAIPRQTNAETGYENRVTMANYENSSTAILTGISHEGTVTLVGVSSNLNKRTIAAVGNSNGFAAHADTLSATSGGQINILCTGSSTGSATVAVSGGSGSYTYFWSPSGTTTPTASGLAAGIHTVTITDGNDDQTTYSFTILEPAAISLTPSQTNLLCHGGNTGSATVLATGGTAPYTYSWTSSGGTAATASGLLQGNYTVTVTDANQCQATHTFTITQPTTLQINSGTTSISCHGGNTGKIEVFPYGGTYPYTYVWSHGSDTTSTVSNLSAGPYSVLISDANGCTISKSFNLQEPPTPISISSSTSTDVTCDGPNTGSASVQVTGGTPNYSYNWFPTGGNNASATGLSAGTYTVTARDRFSCETTQTFTILPAYTVALESKTDVSCNNIFSGSATVKVTGGTPGFTYSWAPSGGTGATASGLSAGTYTVTVTDANQCQSTLTVIIAPPPTLLTTPLLQTNVSCNGGSNGSVTVDASGGTAPYTYLWSHGPETGPSVSGLTAGNYTVTVTDANDCTTTLTVTITEPSALILHSWVSELTCVGSNTGEISVNAQFGTAPYSYLWSHNNATTTTIRNLPAGSYTVTVTDANGCSIQSTLSIDPPANPLSIASISSTPLNCGGATNGTATVVPQGGTGTYFYSWAPYGGSGATATGLAAGTYTVTVRDFFDCVVTQDITITGPPALVATVGSQTNVSCNGGANGSATVNVTGGTGNYTYYWPHNGGTTATASGLAAGTYSVTITDANDCQIIQNVNIFHPALALDGTISKTDVSCNGGNNGTATVNATGGTAPYTYSWAPTGGTNASATGLAAGIYTVTITDNNNCQITRTVTVNQPASALGATVSTTNVSCFGGNNGTATVTPSGGTASYTYSWSPSGGTSATATGLASGTYTVTVTDFNGCQITINATLTQPPVLLATASTTDVSCYGGSNGTATVNVSGGVGTYTYSWAPYGGTNASATGLAAGTYTVTITDSNNCQISQTVTVNQPASTLSGTISKTDVSCNGGNNGTATANATGGTAPYTYSWAPTGGTNASATGLAAGIYTVIISDNNNCQITRTVTVNQPASALGAAVSTTNVSCFGGNNGTATVTPSGGTASYTYSWSPSGGTAATATGLASGTYTVTVTDFNGCQITRTVTVDQPAAALTANATKTDASCNGGSNGTATVSVTGGVGPYSYSWSPSGGTNATATGLFSGTYTVTITDYNGCQITRNVTVGQPTAFTVATSKTDVSCFTGNNGTATVNVSGATGPYTYSWSPSGGTNATATGLAMGTYTVTITDNNTCQTTRTVTVNQPASALSGTISKTDVSCNGGNNGTATVTATGGTAPYSYAWSPSGGSNATATGLASGTYTVTVTDFNGCQITRSVTVDQPTSALMTYTGQSNIACNGGSNGSAQVNPSGGTAPYTYSWSTGSTNYFTTGLTAGNYWVTITDNNGCQITQNFTITDFPALEASTSKTDVSCYGGNNGTATVSVTGGVGPYTYSWAPSGGTNATATGLAAGTYTVTITDNNNCQNTRTVTVEQPVSALSGSISKTDVSCNGGNNGTATVTATGGTAPYSYSWSHSGGTAATATSLTARTYTVTITDANACQITQDITITEPTAMLSVIPVAQTNIACYGAATGAATVSASGGTAPYTYSWSPSGGTSTTASGLLAGTFTVTVTDINGCTASDLFTITQPAATLTASPGTVNHVSCNGGSTGTATVIPSGGTPAYTYSWAPYGGTAATATGLAAGTFTVTVKDAFGCTTTQSFTITEPTGLIATAGTQWNVSCFGGTNGSATVNVTGGTGSYTYSWSPSGGTGATATGLAPGIYTVTVKDANNCHTTQSFIITQPPRLVASISKTDVLCNGGTNGTATVIPTGGAGGYTYLWSPSGGTAATATGLAAGTYSVVISDNNGCHIGRSITVDQPSTPFVTTASKTDISCFGGDNGTATVTPSGGTSPYSYSWSPSGGTNATATGLTAGTYTATVTDSKGCTVTQDLTITEPPTLTVGSMVNHASCNRNADITVYPGGGVGGYTLLWAHNGSTTATISDLTPGNYTVLVTDANGCSITRNFPVTTSNILSATTSQTEISCAGTATGSATVNPSGYPGPFTYVWAPYGGNDATASNLSAGSYSVTISAANGCSIVKNFTFTDPSPMILSAGGQTNLNCGDGTTGTASVNVTGGSGTYTYAWAPSGGSAATATGLSAGTYTVTVTDAYLCSQTMDFIITSPAALVASAYAQSNVSCNGGSNGSATVSVTGGTGAYTYSWAPSGGTAATASGLAPGTYTVTVTDANNCQTTQSFTITEPDALVASTGAQINVSCNGGSNGSATVNVTGGTGSYSYSWAPTGGSSDRASGLREGTYTVTVTDANNCQTTQSFTITQPAVLSASGSQTNVLCNGSATGTATVTPSGGSGNYTYAWSPSGGNQATATGLTAGNYSCLITDASGCFITVPFTLVPPTLLSASTSQVNATCSTGGQAAVSVSGGVGTYSYLWSPSGLTSPVATGLSGGSHSVLITDANGCSITRNFTISTTNTLVATSYQTDILCAGSATGSAGVVPSGAAGPFTYQWAPSGGNLDVATNLSAGNYSVTITSANGCSIVKNFTISEPDALVLSAGSQTNLICAGGTNGSATVNVTGGTGSYTYSWAPFGGTAATATGLTPGTYTVTVSDANNCTKTLDFTITAPAALAASAASQTNVSCNGGTNGSATVSVSGGTGAYTYSWAPSGGTAATASGLAANTYTVTVTDANGCFTTQSFTITEPDALVATAASQTNVAAFGAATGSATVNVSGGTGTYTYAWAPSGGTAATATGLLAGTYTVTVSDANGCTATRTFDITQPASALTASISASTDVRCNNGANGSATVTVTGGASPYTYSWSPSGGSAATASGLAAGTYTVTVTDDHNISTTAQVIITQPAALLATPGAQTNVSCNGGTNGSATVSVTGGTGVYTYSWSLSGGTAATASGLAEGTYTVTVKDANTCQTTQSFIITEPDALVATAASQTNVTAFGAATGSATVNVTGGTGAYTYAWAPSGGTAATATGLLAGTYTVTVSDANGCTATRTFDITQPASALTASISASTDVRCNNGANGSATVTVTGGASPYTYSWSPSGGSAATASGLAAGTYTVTVTDNNNISTTAQVTINQPAALVATAGAQTNVTCNGGTNGSATVSVTGGTGTYTYSWSPSGGTAATASGLAEGTYTVTVKDANTCQTTQSFIITEPAALVASAGAQTNVTAFGAATGSATVNVTGGTGAYTYAWAPSGGTAATATGLLAGTYTVTVSDANGCTATQSFTITQPSSALSASISASTNVSCFALTNGSSTVTASGGTSPYTYSWSPSGGTAATATGLAAGTYTVTVTDDHNISTTAQIIITQPAALLATPGAQTNVTCNGGTNGSATVSVTGGTGVYTYSWSPSGGTAATASGLAEGTYTVTVTDANTCQTTQSFTLTQPTLLSATSGGQVDVTAFGAATGSATVNVTGGTGAYTYAWAPSGGTAATATGLLAGTYTVTVSDANGCTATQSFTITQPSSALSASISASTNVSCFALTNGSATVTASGGTSPYTYSWSPSGGTAATATGLAAGTYTVTVTDDHNISTTAQINITQPAALLATPGAQTNVTCNGGTNGSATVSVTGGTGTYTYSWSPSGGTAATASGLAEGTYTVTVKDANTCQTTQSFIITEPAALMASAGAQTNVTAFGAATGAATVDVTGGTGAYTYSWAPSGGTAATATGLLAGTYTVTVSDANGCTATQSFTITQPSSALSASISASTNVSCFALTNGSATVTASGGTSPYTYSWSPSGGTAATASGLAAGTYTVTVTDDHNISTTTQVIITQPTTLVASSGGQVNVVAFGTATGSATVNVSGGTAPYTYSWAPSGGTAATATGLLAGTYSVTVTDASGCFTSQSFTITQPSAALAATFTATAVTCQGGNDGAASLAVSGGTAPYTYVWTGSASTTASASGLSAGTYTVAISDANNVSINVPVIVPNATAFSSSITVTGPTELCEDDVTLLTASAATSYLWSNGATTASLSVDTPGTYTVTLTSALGCVSTASQVITQKICNVPPVAVCKEVVVLVAKDNCYATLRAEDIDAGSYDANGDWFNRSFDIQPDLKVGTHYVNFFVQDIHGTSGTCMTRVDVLDHSAPVALTKNITLKLSEASSITPQMIDNGSHDGCGSVQLSLNQASFDCSHLGDTQVILIVTDAAGNKATEVATVTVIDDVYPTLLQNTFTLALDKEGKAVLTQEMVKSIATDNCAVWEVQMDKSAFDCDNIGENHVNITLVDVYSNRTSAVLTLVVKDTLAPVLAGREFTLYLDQKGQATLSGTKLEDNCSTATIQAEKDSFSCADLGTHRLLVKATDAYGNTATDTLTVHVKDTLAPVIKTKTAVLALDASGTAILSPEMVDAGSSDNCSILTRTLSRTSFSCSELGQHTVLYTLTDAAGNTVSDSVKVQVLDQTAPSVRTQTVVLELSNEGTATLSVDQVNDGSTDNCSITSMSLSQTAFSCTDLGTRTVLLTVVDASGNSAAAQAEVIVRDPDAVCPCSFGIIADAEINLKDNAVLAGGLGVISGKIILRNTLLDEEGTFAKANTKDFDEASSASKFLQGSAPAIPARVTNPDKKKGREKISGKEQLKAGKYGKLILKKGAELSLSGDVYVRRLVVRKEAKINFTAPGRIIARDRAKFGKDSELSGVGAKLFTARATKIKKGALIKAYVHVGSLLQVKGARMEGFFAAHTVKGSKNATWSGGGVLCKENETSALQKEMESKPQARISADTLVLEVQISMKLSPNPAAENVLVKLHAPSGKGQLSLHDLKGSTLATVSVNAKDFEHRFVLKNVLPGTYIVRYQDGSESKTLRLVKEEY